MRVIYNGIDLMPLETHAFDWEPVYDDSGTDYLFTRVSIVVRAVINGQAEIVFPVGLRPGGVGTPPGPFMSYDIGAPSPGSLADAARAVRPDPNTPVRPGPVLGKEPPGTGIDNAPAGTLVAIARAVNRPLLTHRAIRHRLTTPRGKLFVFAGSGMESGVPAPGTDAPPVAATITLTSPLAGNTCDCKNGPIPRILSMPTVHGDAETLMVDWACETYVNENELNGVNPSGVLLSNRFSQTHVVDDHGYTTVVTEGDAVFRADMVYRLPASPDADRPVLFMPIQFGFVRENIQVTGHPDSLGVHYSYQDRQVPVNFVAGPYCKAASISAVHRQAIVTNTDVLGGALSAYERILGLTANKNFAFPGSDEAAVARRGMRRGHWKKGKRRKPPPPPP